LQEIDGVGPSVSQAVVDWFQLPRNQALLEKLKRLGAWPVSATRSARVTEGPFAGQTFVITGTLPNWSREEAKAFIEARGGKLTDNVSKKTSYLILGEAPGSKFAKAQSLGVPIVDEAVLRKLGAEPV
jgi:DNA ligase (NAD+)